MNFVQPLGPEFGRYYYISIILLKNVDLLKKGFENHPIVSNDNLILSP